MAFTDDELMARVRAGHADAVTELYARFQRPLFTYLARLTGNRELAEDLLQETFIRVHRGREAYQPSGHFRAWLFTIARHMLIDWARRERVAWELRPALEENAVAPDRTESRAEALDLIARLERALQRLPRDDREVIVLSRVVGMDAEEISRATGGTAGAVRVRLHRALRRLAELLGE